jgi:hypothetical protein
MDPVGRLWNTRIELRRGLRFCVVGFGLTLPITHDLRQNMADDNILVGPFNKDTRPPLELLLADTEREIARLQQIAI